jgi:hypothetical protein
MVVKYYWHNRLTQFIRDKPISLGYELKSSSCNKRTLLQLQLYFGKDS